MKLLTTLLALGFLTNTPLAGSSKITYTGKDDFGSPLRAELISSKTLPTGDEDTVAIGTEIDYEASFKVYLKNKLVYSRHLSEEGDTNREINDRSYDFTPA